MSGSGWRTRLGDALVDAREYTRRCYAHLEAGDVAFPLIATVNPARWELGHVAWFQEYWCLRHGNAMRPGDPAASAEVVKLQAPLRAPVLASPR